MSAAEFVHHLSGVRSAGAGKWISLCPAHEDHSPSLSVRQAHDRTLIKCWAGCTAENVVKSIGLSLADLYSGYHRKPDASVMRRHRAFEKLESWRQSELQRIAEDLRTRDTTMGAITRMVQDGEITPDEVWDTVASEYRAYPELEYRFDQLLRDENTVALWRKSWRTA